MPGEGNESGTGTFGKAIDVLQAVASSPYPPRFTDLLQLVGQPRGTLHRQISNLIEEGLLSLRRDHSYELGLTLLEARVSRLGGKSVPSHRRASSSSPA